MSSPCSRNKRKREASEPESSSCGSPTSSLSFSSLHDKGKDRLLLVEEEESGRYSPRTSVARSLKDLAIYDSSSHDEEADGGGKSPLQWRVGDAPPPAGGETVEQDVGTAARDSSSSERKKKQPISVSRKVAMFTHNRRRLSPPPPEPESCSESEITGCNPADPNEDDDGYGINGIGFKPTPAIAWARAQKRQRQIAEWKRREAREARERRLERRHGVAHAAAAARALSDGVVQKRVKFALDG
ncbi:hypothetical protein VTN31DRAFT_3990 [Thermomyces dupontii]|uniref:uncharacterized protein n=1 Tax=Talaromyces thermophilus TaxID=28565 RepID=UPI003742878A